MNQSTKAKLQGTAVALAVAGLMGCTSVAGDSSYNTAKTSATNTVEMAHCYGVNACSGHNDCKTADNACKGQAACKGQGFVALSAKTCGDVGGTVGS